ncbi:MAG: dienelactone hydrolase family protein [bacterium]
MGGSLPEFQVIPAKAGTQLVRVSLPFPAGSFPGELGLAVKRGEETMVPDIRVLTFHPGRPKYVRRALITFPYAFTDLQPVLFTLSLQVAPPKMISSPVEEQDGSIHCVIGDREIVLRGQGLEITGKDQPFWRATWIAPERVSGSTPALEVIESSPNYLWLRWLMYDRHWPRILELRADSLGTVAAQLHLQNHNSTPPIEAIAPELGWRIEGPAITELQVGALISSVKSDWSESSFKGGDSAFLHARPEILSFPRAPFTRRGSLRVRQDDRLSEVVYYRSLPDEKVPHQYTAWRNAAFVIAGPGQCMWTAWLEPPHSIRIGAEFFDSLYDSGLPPDLSPAPILDDIAAGHRDAIARSARVGDDFGNVTGFNHLGEAPDHGMNRLNHCPPIFEEYYRSGDERLRATALLWCGNFHDLSIWWGDKPGKQGFGGTRYNNAAAAGQEVPGNSDYMWRTDSASDFCTKGYDSFFYAFEETGDPRMAVALRSQTAYAEEWVHADQGECRNIGDVRDFMRLYRFTGNERYHQQALRLFRELRARLSPGDLFSQGGDPIETDIPFIADDQAEYRHPFAKPYIIGYGLAGLPELVTANPDESRLRETVRAVARFMADSQDALGAWRYPHPRSPSMILCQSMEHAAQLVNALPLFDGGVDDGDHLLDAIERTLRLRILGWRKSGTVLHSLGAWEQAGGILREGKTFYDLYSHFSDRDYSRDYTEGGIGAGSSSPEGLVYFTKVLSAYAQRRPLERLFRASPTLATVLQRLDDRRLRLIPQSQGSFLRVEHPDSHETGFLLWAPEWITFPSLGYSQAELGGMEIPWKTDPESGLVSYTLNRPEADFTAAFLPAADYVDCFYTVWPKSAEGMPASLGIGPCLQLKQGIFEGEDEELMSRIHYVSEGRWIPLGSVAGGNRRNVLYTRGNPSPEMAGEMAQSGWRTIQRQRPDVPLIAAVSRDGQWIASIATEHSSSICNNANASHRCIHSQGNTLLLHEGPTILRMRVYLFQGRLDDLHDRYQRDVNQWQSSPPVPVPADTQSVRYGMARDLPRFHESRVQAMDFPMAYDPSGKMSYSEWRERAREIYLHSLLTPPPRAPFEPAVLAKEDRGTYEARKIVFNVSAYSRVPAYVLVPKGKGPFPAVIALHDHGAHFSIGKEKVVRPFDVSRERAEDARQWVDQYYGGRFFGDELAKRGYVVFAMDALFWGDRGRLEGVQYEAQQALAANLLQLGMSWAGTIVWDDIRSAELVAGLPEVDPARVGAMGLSMGGHRTWNLAAATDRVLAGAAICWLGDTATLMKPGNNQTKGYSAFSMIHPGLRNELDYPDVASIACPKPMLFYNGDQDALFPVAGVREAYRKMRMVWQSQQADDRLVTKIWPVPHEFNRDMQEEAFVWLDRYLHPDHSNDRE